MGRLTLAEQLRRRPELRIGAYFEAFMLGIREPRRAVASFFSRRRLPERGDAARGDAADRGPAAGPAVCGRPRFMVRHGAPGAPLCSTRGGGWLWSCLVYASGAADE